MRRANSSWYSLPRYSRHSLASWLPTLQKNSFVRELWPAQRLLGECGILSGRSGVVQMPTSAGKTRATEIIIRSAFLGNRTELAVIVAPFRALCNEIRDSLSAAFRGEWINVDELSDVFQADFDVDLLLKGKHVIVVTPEKLVYVLRQNPELAVKIGLLIYDEGHQFDNGTRGVTFELLVTSLKALAPKDAQTVLISAVISNAEAINGWLNRDDSVVASGTHLGPTFRSFAFASWQDTLGRLEFVAENDLEKGEFFVPRLIEQIQLHKKPKERKNRTFPNKDDGSSVALYLGLKLVPSGSVAVFCGTKPSAAAVCEMATDIFARSVPLHKPIEYSNRDEIQRLCFLHERNLGSDAIATQSAKLGVFAHHGNTPHGIRLAVEYATKENLVKFVVCTSTLAQGVNLPIRYLIVNTTRQGSDTIKVRDFHNLIGRAGRSGMYTEGSILFANPGIYDHREVVKERWRWDNIRDLLNPRNAEPCISTLLAVFGPLKSRDGKRALKMQPLDFVLTYINNPSGLDGLAKELAAKFGNEGFVEDELAGQIAYKKNIISAIESYLMAYWSKAEADSTEDSVAGLARGTLAYYLAKDDEEVRKQLIDLFILLARNIEQKVPEMDRRRGFGRTLYGLLDSIAIEQWVTENAGRILECESQDELASVIWPLLARYVRNRPFNRCNPASVLRDVAMGWLQGQSYDELFSILTNASVRFGAGKGARYPTLDNVVDICENGLAYDGMLAIGAVAEILERLRPEEKGASDRLRLLQKRVKYGLPSASEISVYELGFSDRVISLELSGLLNGVTSRGSARQQIELNEARVRASLEKYPSYFGRIMDGL